MTPLVRDAVELLFVVALGGMLWSAIVKLRRGYVSVPTCTGCQRPVSRAYEHCPRCGVEISARRPDRRPQSE